MTRVVRACKQHGTRVGAHPSYVDRAGFGRRAIDVAPQELARQVEEQCSALRRIGEHEGVIVGSAKPHGALYHAAYRDAEIARACVDGITRALGHVTVVGLPGGELEIASAEAGLPYAREAFADRGVYPDGTLIPRGQPGALVADPAAARARALVLAKRDDVDTICVHGDTPGAVAVAEAVRIALEAARGDGE